METLLKAEDLSVHYSTKRGYVHALDGINLAIGRGETLGIVGETGSGKSTFAKAILGILPPKSRIEGRLQFHETDLARIDAEYFRRIRGKEIALIFQDPMTRLNPLMRIEDHFVETIKAHEPVSESAASARAVRALTSMRAPESRIRTYLPAFSGAMRQRMMDALASALKRSALVAAQP